MPWLKSNGDVLLILVVACALRISFVGLMHEQGYTSDEKEYISLARNLADGKPFIDSNGEWSTKAPLWPFTLSLVFRVFGIGLLIPCLFNCLLGTIVVYLGFRLCWELLENRLVALISATLLAVYPSLIIYSDILQAEAMYIVFVLLTFVCVERMQKHPTSMNAVWLGVFAGLATLTRAVFFGYFPFLLILVLIIHERARRAVPIICLAFIAWSFVLLPWIIRNYGVHSTFVPISSWGGISLLLGNNPYSTGTWSSKPGFNDWFAAKAKENGVELAQSNEIQRSALGKKLAIEFMTSDPVGAATLAVKKFYMHWIYPITNSDSNTKLQAVAVAGDVALYTFAGLGFLAMAGIRKKLAPIVMAIVFFTVLQVVMHCEARYRLPIMPLVAVFSASGVALLVDTRAVKEFLNIRRNRILSASWVATVVGVYSFTAWQFLSGKI